LRSCTHALAQRPGTVVLPDAERVFNPSRETRRILSQAQAIGADAQRLCQLLFAIEGRVGQRKLWGIVQLARQHPRQMVNAACAQALDEGVHSYRHVKALTERLVAQALERLDRQERLEGAEPGPPAGGPVQAHELIRSPQEYGELFAKAARSSAEPGPEIDPESGPASDAQAELFA